MKQLFFILLFSPLLSTAQKNVPRYEYDTLYTSCGYKIYKGQTLHFGKGTGNDGRLRFVNSKNGVPDSKLINNSIVVKKMKNFGISALGNAYIEIIGSIIYKDGSKGGIDIHMAFDNAIKGFGGLPGELIVPDEFKYKENTSDEINKLYKLYLDGIITKEEFEKQKQKLLSNN
jgi:hypothetical protein